MMTRKISTIFVCFCLTVSFLQAGEPIGINKSKLPAKNADGSRAQMLDADYLRARSCMNVSRHDIQIADRNVKSIGKYAAMDHHGHLIYGFYITDNKGRGHILKSTKINQTFTFRFLELDGKCAIIFQGHNASDSAIQYNKADDSKGYCSYVIATPYIMADFEFGKRYRINFDLKFYDKNDQLVCHNKQADELSYYIRKGL